MSKIESKILPSVDLGKTVQNTIQFYKAKHFLHIEEMDFIVDGLKAVAQQRNKKIRIALIRVLNGDKWVTFTTESDYNDYYEGKVKDVAKFDDFYQTQITIITTK